MRPGLRLSAAVASVLAATALLAGGVANAGGVTGSEPVASTPAVAGVYAGGSPHGARQMDIQLQVLHGGARANWRVDVSGPCVNSDDRLGRTVGTDAGSTPPDKQLRLHDGQFTLSKNAVDHLDGLHYQYVLTGHAVRGGFAGTFHYQETDYGVTCKSSLVHWQARRSRQTFP